MDEYEPDPPFSRQARLHGRQLASREKTNKSRYRRFLPSPLAVGVCAVILIIACVAGGIIRSQGASKALASSNKSAAGSFTEATQPSGITTTPMGIPTAETTTPDNKIKVHVTGQVNHPGVYTLEADSRVDDAIQAAGGVCDPNDVNALNLAKVLNDGEQIVVPLPGEAPLTGAGGSQAGGGGGGKVNLNQAGLEELQSLDGVGPTLAKRILSYRETNGPFKQIEQLKQVEGIGEKKYLALADQVTL